MTEWTSRLPRARRPPRCSAVVARARAARGTRGCASTWRGRLFRRAGVAAEHLLPVGPTHVRVGGEPGKPQDAGVGSRARLPVGRVVVRGSGADRQPETLKWLRARGCPWDRRTCASASNNGHFGVYLWARANGCPNCHPDDKTGRSHRSNLLLETIVRLRLRRSRRRRRKRRKRRRRRLRRRVKTKNTRSRRMLFFNPSSARNTRG